MVRDREGNSNSGRSASLGSMHELKVMRPGLRLVQLNAFRLQVVRVLALLGRAYKSR